MISYNEFRRRREGGESVSQIFDSPSTEQSKQYQQTMNKSGLPTYEQFRSAREQGLSASDVFSRFAANTTQPAKEVKRESSSPTVSSAEQRRQDRRSEAEQKRSLARTAYSDLLTARDGIKLQTDEMLADYNRRIESGEREEDLSDYYSKILARQEKGADYDRRVDEAYKALLAADKEYKEIYSEYNAARSEVKASKRNLRDVESQYSGWATDELSAHNIEAAMDDADDVKDARERLARAREEYIKQGGNPDANIVSAGLKGSAAGVVDTFGYLQELAQPENEKRWGIFTTGHMTEEDRHRQQVLEERRKAKYEAEHGAGTYEYKPAYIRTQDTAARLARESAEETASMKAGRSELGQFGVDMGVQGVQMGADAIAGKVLPGGSLTSMALRTFGSGVREARESGANIYQQGLYGAGTAAVEVLTEKMFDGVAGIYGSGVADDVVSHAIGKFTDNKLGQAALGMLVDALGEGSEEVISDIINPFLRTIYDKNVFQDGFWAAFNGEEILYDFLVGAAMGFVGGSIETVSEVTGLKAPDARSEFFMEAGQNGMSFDQALDTWKQNQLASGFAGQVSDTSLQNQSNEYRQLIEEGKGYKVSERKIAKLNERAANQISLEDMRNTAGAVQSRLQQFGVEDNALAQAITAVALESEAERIGAKGVSATETQRKMVKESTVAQRILSEMDVENLRREQTAEYINRLAALTGASAEDLQRNVEPYQRTNNWVKELAGNKALAADVYGSQAATSTISESEKNGVTLDGQKVRIVGAQDGKVTVEKNGQRQTVELDELQGLSDGYRQLIEAAGETKSAEPMLRLYQPGQDVGRYISAWNYAENVFGAQTTNATLEEVRKSPLVKELDDVQLKYAFEMGRERAQQRAQEVKVKAQERKAAREEAKKRGAEKRRKGTVSVDGAEINGKKYKGVNEKKMTTSQKKVVAMVRALADAVNIDYVVYDGNPDEGGTYVKGGTVLININSGQLSTKNLGAATVSHELTHYLQDFAPEEYEQLKGFITQHIMKKSPAQFDALVLQQQKLDPKLSYDKAVDELVANACQKMLLNSRAVTQLARQNMTLAEKIQDAIADISEKIKAAFEGVDLKDDIAVYRAAREISDVMDQVQELWDKALLAADASYNAVEQTGMRSASDTSGEAQLMAWDSDTEYDFGINQRDINTYVENAYQNANENAYQKYAKVEERLAQDVGDDIPDIEEYTHAIRDNDIRHVRNSHGEQTNEKYPVTENDQKLIPFIVKNYDKVIVKTDHKGRPGIVYVKAMSDNLVYYLEAVTSEYGGEKLLVNKQMIKTGYGDIPHLYGLKDAIAKKETLAEFLTDLDQVRKAYARSASQQKSLSDASIADADAKSNPQNLDEEQHQRWGMAETDEEREARRESVANLKAENRILRARAEYWKGQTQQTRERTVRQQDTDRLANDLLREYESRADKAEVKAALKELGDWLVQSDGDTLSYDELRERARAIAEDIVDGNYALIDDSQSEMLGRLKDYLKSTPVNLSAADWRDTGDEYFRRRYGRYFTVSERGRTIDSLWGELSATFGESLFPEDTYAPGDMLNMIGDYLDLWKPQYGNVFEQYRGEAVDAAANEIIDAMLGEEVRQSAATYADRAQQRLNAQIAKDKDRLDALREQKNARIEEIKREAAEKVRQVRLSEKAMKYEAVDKVKQHYRDMMQRQRGKRSDTALRGKIKKLHRELSDMLVKPGEKRYVPRELVKATAEILNSIDTTSGRAIKAKAALAELRVQYEAMAKDDHYALTYDETVSGMLQELAENIGDGSIYDLRGSELESVYNVLRALKTTIQNANRLVGAQIEATAFEAGNQMMTEATNAKSVPTVLLRKFVFGQATPETAFSLFGGYKKNSMWHQMYEMLNRGQLTQTQIMMEGGAIFRELIDDKQMKTLHDRKNLVDIGMKDAEGNAILVTRGMMLSVYMHLQNEQNTRHIAYGGLTVPRLREYYNSKMKEAFTGKTGHAVAFFEEIQEVNRQLAEAETQEEKDALSERLAELQDETDAYIDGMRSKIEEQLTEYDRKWIAAAQEFFDVYSKGKLNEVTEMVYGFQKAQVERYFPIHTDPDYRTANFDTITRDMSLENAGFMKERVTASNPILLEDITDVISSQLRRTAQYCGLMPVIRNFNKAYGKSRTGYTMTVQKAVGETFRVEGKKYIENLIADLNGARTAEADIFDMLRGNMAGAVLTLNPRVALSQAASYPTAAAEIGYKPLAKALKDIKDNPKWNEQAREEVAKWTPLWWYRMQGYSTVELGDIKSNEQMMNKVMQKMKWATGWIQFMDGMTTGALWQASKYYVDENFSDLRRGSDEYMMKVAEVYNRVIERTQPDYTTMQRPDILRSPNKLYRQLTMFMTQRLQNTNLLFSAAAEYAKFSRDLKGGYNGVTVEDVKTARTRLLWAVSSQMAASAAIVAFKLLADALLHSMNAYRDDDDELTKESISRKLLQNFIETLSSNVLWGSEIYTALKSVVTGERYYGISLNGVDTLKDLLEDGVKTLGKIWKGDWEGAKPAAWKLTKALAQFFGVPLANMEKISNMVVNHVEDIRNGEFGSFEAGVDRTRTQNTRLLYEALQAGDTKKAEKLKEEIGDEKAVRSALKTYIKQIYTEDKQIMKAEVVSLLQRYCGMTRKNAENTAQQWTMQVVTGMSYDKLGDEYIAGNVPRNTASRYLQTYGGKTQAEAEEKLNEWQCEKDTGIAYSDIANEVKIGNISPERAVDMLVKYGGKDPDAAEKTVEGYMIEHEYGFSPSDLQDEYLAGNVSDADAFDILMSYKYFGKEDAEEKSADELERLQFVRANPGTEEISITQARNYQSSGLSGYISPVDYMQAAKMMGTFHGVDADGNGKSDPYSKVTQQLAYIDTLELTPEQKSRLAQALGINEKTIRKKAPWLK